MIDSDYDGLVDAIARRMAAAVPAGVTVLVIGRGDDRLVDRLPTDSWHFPRAPDGSWLGYHLSGDDAAVAHLESLRALGADMLLLPATSRWWLEQYRGFANHLDSRYVRVVDDETCVLFDVRSAVPRPWTDCLDALTNRIAQQSGERPTVVDWDTGRSLALHLPACAVIERPRAGERLPDLDGTVDVVALAAGDAQRLAEAQRVAAAAVAQFAGQGALRTAWCRQPPANGSPPLLIAPCDLRLAPTTRRLQGLRETFPGDVVAVVERGSPAVFEARAARRRLGRVDVLEVDAPGRLLDVLARVLDTTSADLVALAAPDALPLPGWWRAALRTLTSRAEAGAVAGRMRGDDGEGERSGSIPPLVRQVAESATGLLVASRLALEQLAPRASAGSEPSSVGELVGELAARGTAVYEDPQVAAVRATREDVDAPLGSSRTPSALSPERRRVALVLVQRPELDAAAAPQARMLEHAQALARAGWAVTLLALAGPVPAEIAQPLVDRGIAVGVASDPLEDVVAAGDVDVVVLEGWAMAAQLSAIRRAGEARVLIDCGELELLRSRGSTAAGVPPEATLLDDQDLRALAAELRVYAAADGILVSCERDAALVSDACGAATPVHVVRATTPRLSTATAQAERRGIIFVGQPEPADIAALHWLCTEIVPRLSEKTLHEHPVHVVGGGLEPYLAVAARGLDGIRPVGAMPALAAYLARARVLLCSPAAATGVRPAVAAAVAAGMPIVAPAVVAEDLELADGEGVAVADDAASFVRATRLLLADRDAWERTSRAGQRRMQAMRQDHSGQRASHAAAATLTRPPKNQLLEAADLEHVAWRQSYVESNRVCRPIRATVERLLPEAATVAVVSDGMTELVRLAPRHAHHFPQAEDGTHREFTPHDPQALFEHLAELRVRGAGHLIVPRAQRWWLRYYPELDEHLRREHRVLADDDHCLLVELLPARRGNGARPATSPAGNEPLARLIAFYLPQYHPVAENDAWWGPGFTEWTNVGRADPLFSGHQQPHVPGELGFYDLRVPETRRAQADLARAYGLHGFCYYHYWFHGERLLERPFAEILTSGEPDFPFCLCWANEPWSRRWDGGSEAVLQPQCYSAENDRAHIEWLLPALADPRAITVDGRPLFLVYRARSLPDPARTVATWRRAVRQAGLPGLHLVAVETARDAGWDATAFGFDAKLHFAPQFRLLSGLEQESLEGRPNGLRVYDYQSAWKVLANPEPVGYPRYETVCPRWDNTPRAGARGLVLHNSSPNAYHEWLTLAIARAARRSPDERLVFVNAWNEWGEGCHLEPDVADGRAYLEATANALAAAREHGRGLVAVRGALA